MTQKRRRVYEVVERLEYPYFEVGDKVKIAPGYRHHQPYLVDGEYQWGASDTALAQFTVKAYIPPKDTSYYAEMLLMELPGEYLASRRFMPADWTDEEWEASEANPLIVNRPIVPEINVEFKNGNAAAVLGKLLSELAALHQQETEFFTRLKEKEAELETLARPQVASQSDKG